jgi:hypothetical protein
MDVVSTEAATPTDLVVHNRCTSCRALLRFEKTPYGSKMPFDAEPVLVDGAYEIRDGLAHYVPKDMREGKGPLFVPHFARCTNPDGHRKQKRGK